MISDESSLADDWPNKTFFSSAERLVSMISDESSLADDWSIASLSLSLLVTNSSSSSSFSNTLSEFFSRTISFGGKMVPKQISCLNFQ